MFTWDRTIAEFHTTKVQLISPRPCLEHQTAVKRSCRSYADFKGRVKLAAPIRWLHAWASSGPK